MGVRRARRVRVARPMPDVQPMKIAVRGIPVVEGVRLVLEVFTSEMEGILVDGESSGLLHGRLFARTHNR
jgi:hypothetical protein